jgi:hypothetical protein
MQEHTITLKGEAARPEGVTFRVLKSLVPIVGDTCRRVLRLQAEGRSHLNGVPLWLNDVTDLELVTNSDNTSKNNTTRLLIKSPSFQEAAPQIFEQLSLFETSLKPKDSAFNLFEGALADAVNGNSDSSRIDTNILSSAAEFSEILDLGFTSISFNGGPTPPVHITRHSLETVERLKLEAPDSKKVIISGRLDSLKRSRRSFSLISQGRTIRGFFPSEDNHKYQVLWGKNVVIDGEAVFKPSGDLSFIAASHIQAAKEGDKIWENIPRPSPRSIDEISPRNFVYAGSSGAARIFGQWPGDESDEDVIAALEAID